MASIIDDLMKAGFTERDANKMADKVTTTKTGISNGTVIPEGTGVVDPDMHKSYYSLDEIRAKLSKHMTPAQVEDTMRGNRLYGLSDDLHGIYGANPEKKLPKKMAPSTYGDPYKKLDRLGPDHPENLDIAAQLDEGEEWYDPSRQKRENLGPQKMTRKRDPKGQLENLVDVDDNLKQLENLERNDINRDNRRILKNIEENPTNFDLIGEPQSAEGVPTKRTPTDPLAFEQPSTDMVGEATDRDIKRQVLTPEVDDIPTVKKGKLGGYTDDTIEALFRGIPKAKYGPLMKRLALTGAGGAAAVLAEGADASEFGQDMPKIEGHDVIAHEPTSKSFTDPLAGLHTGKQRPDPLDRAIATAPEYIVGDVYENSLINFMDKYKNTGDGIIVDGRQSTLDPYTEQQTGRGSVITDYDKDAAGRAGRYSAKYSDPESRWKLHQAGIDTEHALRNYGSSQQIMTEGEPEPDKGVPYYLARPEDEVIDDKLIDDGSDGRLDPDDGSDDESSYRNKRRDIASMYADQLQQARKADADSNFANIMQRAAEKIGSSIAGTKADYSGVDALDKAKRNYEKDFGKNLAVRKAGEKEEDEMEMRDPDSDMAKLAQDQLFELTGLRTRKSVFELQKMGLPVGNLIGMTQSMKKAKLAQKIKTDKATADAEKGRLKMEASDKKTLVGLYDRLNKLKRGGVMKELGVKQQAILDMKVKLEAAMSGKTKLNMASAKDLSSAWSKVLTGGVPAASLITETMPISLKSDIARMADYIMGQPTIGFYTKKNMQHMKEQLDLLEKATNQNIGNVYAQSLTGYSNLYNKYPTERKLVEAMYGHLVDFDEQGLAKAKSQFGENKKEVKSKSNYSDAYLEKVMKGNPGLTKEQVIGRLDTYNAKKGK